VKSGGFRARLGYAAAGLKAAFARERSFRTHIAVTTAVFVFLLVLRPAPIWWAAVALVVALVLSLELINSALEGVIDLLHPGIHPEIKIIKDMAAGAVLIACFAALIVGAALVWAVGWPMVRDYL